MTIGFEEDSILYNGPLVDTREDANATQVTQKETELMGDEKKTQVNKLEDKPVEEKSQEESTSQESDTTFYYERDDE